MDGKEEIIRSATCRIADTYNAPVNMGATEILQTAVDQAIRCNFGERMVEEARMISAGQEGKYFTIAMRSEMVPVIAASLAEQLGDAKNYTEVHCEVKSNSGRLIFTIQRKDGKSPHQLRVEAEAQRDELIAGLKWMVSPETDWEDGAVGVGGTFRNKAYELLEKVGH